jgi:Stress responsive A/B Barrel Domain
MKQNRRNFIAKISLAAAALAGLSSFTKKTIEQKKKTMFIHHVFFWLKNPDSSTDRDKLVQGLTKLSKVKTIRHFHIGKPADTNREVIERGYAVSWLLQFDNDADQASYQSDPVHLQFIEECSHLWSKVIVYDSVNV